MRARVEVEQLDAELMAAHQLVLEGGHGETALLVIRRGEVDEIRVVAHHLAQARGRACLPEGGNLLLRQGAGAPAPLVAGEDLHCVAANLVTATGGELDPTGGGDVTTYDDFGIGRHHRR